MTTEPNHERFLRNHEETVQIMRAKAIQCRRDGDSETADKIDRITDVWERIAKRVAGENWR